MTKMKEMPNVQYTMSLKYQRQATDSWQDHTRKFDGFVETVRGRLAAYGGIHITGHTYCNATLHAQSTKNDFERLYKVELVLETKPCPDGPIIGFNVDKQPSVPKELEDIVKSITIIQDVVLTDLLD